MIESVLGVEGHQLAVAALLGAYVMCLMPHVLRAYFVLQVRRGRYNLGAPRDMLAKLKEMEKTTEDKELKATLRTISRATAAHENNLENFGVFAAGVLSCILMGAKPEATACWAVSYVVLRFFFNLHYVFSANPKLGFIRSTIWVACLFCVIALYVNAFKAAAPAP